MRGISDEDDDPNVQPQEMGLPVRGAVLDSAAVMALPGSAGRRSG